MIMMTMMSHERMYDTSRIDSTNIRPIGNIHRFIGRNCNSCRLNNKNHIF